METAVKAWKMGRSAGVVIIPVKLVKAGGDAMIVLTPCCSKIKTGKWLTEWTKCLAATFTKKENLQLCQNCRTITLISHRSKVMFKISNHVLIGFKKIFDKVLHAEYQRCCSGPKYNMYNIPGYCPDARLCLTLSEIAEARFSRNRAEFCF